MQTANPIPEAQLQQQFELRAWREITLLMLVWMEASWVTPWFRSLTPATYAVPAWRAALILMGIMLTSLWVVRLMDFLHLRTGIRQGVTLGLLLLSVLLGLRTLLYTHESVPLSLMLTRPLENIADIRTLIPDDFIIAVTVLIGWWRGIGLAQERIGPAVVRDHFVVGIVMYIVYGFINTLVTGETPGGFVIIFLFCSLLGMSSARFLVLSALRGGRHLEFDRRWFAGIITASTITVGLAILFGEAVSKYLDKFAQVIIGLFGLIALLLWLILAPLIALFLHVLNRSENPSPLFQQISEQVDQFQDTMRELMQRVASFVGLDNITNMITRWTPGIKLILLGSLLALVVIGILIWLATQLWHEKKKHQVTEDQNALYGQGDLWRLLLTIYRQRWNSLVNTLSLATDLHRQARLRAAAHIRQVYAEMLDLCEELGYPRPIAQTPLEFIPTLIQCFPGQEMTVGIITQAYISVRYGELPESHQEVLEVDGAWKQVQQIGKEKLNLQKQHKAQPGHLIVKSAQKPRSDR